MTVSVLTKRENEVLDALNATIISAIVKQREWLDEKLRSHASRTARTQDVVTCRRYNGWWCPELCPFTLDPFFMWIEHPELGWLPTYGGPYDSYTIPEPEKPDGPGAVAQIDVEYVWYRYDHDLGDWVDGVEVTEFRVTNKDTLSELGAWLE